MVAMLNKPGNVLVIQTLQQDSFVTASSVRNRLPESPYASMCPQVPKTILDEADGFLAFLSGSFQQLVVS